MYFLFVWLIWKLIVYLLEYFDGFFIIFFEFWIIGVFGCWRVCDRSWGGYSSISGLDVRIVVRRVCVGVCYIDRICSSILGIFLIIFSVFSSRSCSIDYRGKGDGWR